MNILRTRRLAVVVAAGVLGLALAGPSQGADAPQPDGAGEASAKASPRSLPWSSAGLPMRRVQGYYEMPFPCGEAWTGSTRASHSPSKKAVDWNRPDDEGDVVVASAPGEVTIAQRKKTTSGYGKYVVIAHPGGESTLYAHLQKVMVRRGSTVDQGAQIGLLGSTGNSTGPHLHYEQRPSVEGWSKVYFEGLKYKYGTTAVSGNCVDAPLAGNMVGDGRSELVIYRRGAQAQFLVQQPGLEPIAIAWGTNGDDPVIGDWNGDGIDDVGIRRPSDNSFYLMGIPGATPFGIEGDRPIAGDWDGDGIDQIGVRRDSNATFYLAMPGGNIVEVPFGDADDLPITGDWNGDRITDLGVYDPATSVFSLRMADAKGQVWTTQIPYGGPGDLPIAGDWDGNGVSDIGVWRSGTAIFAKREAAKPFARSSAVTETKFGRPRTWRP